MRRWREGNGESRRAERDEMVLEVGGVPGHRSETDNEWHRKGKTFATQDTMEKRNGYSTKTMAGIFLLLLFSSLFPLGAAAQSIYDRSDVKTNFYHHPFFDI